jgi:hypothetical protein
VASLSFSLNQEPIDQTVTWLQQRQLQFRLAVDGRGWRPTRQLYDTVLWLLTVLCTTGVSLCACMLLGDMVADIANLAVPESDVVAIDSLCVSERH